MPRYQFIPAVLFVSLCNLQEVCCFTVTSVSSCQAAVSHLVNQCNSCQLFMGVNHYQNGDYYPSTKFQLWITDIIIPFSTCNSKGQDNVPELLNSTSSNHFCGNTAGVPDQGVCVIIIFAQFYPDDLLISGRR